MTTARAASKRELTRAQILDATVAVIAREGTAGVRIDAVAAAAGVSTGLIYYHFSSRQVLVRAGLAEALERYPSQPRSPGGREPLTHLVEELQRHIGLPEDDGESRGRVRTAGLQAAVFDPELRPALTHSTELWEAVVARLVGRVRGAKANPVADASTAEMLTAIGDGVRQRVLSGTLPRADAARLIASIVPVLVAGGAA
ncbi:TetR/AcrR family transcriptional regulator [Nocardioides carbamazepini]|uniref:TetR/AcrR family transcriptional regulator n=1 Tax=Nocardioides carbamazepini TaxID=2854259 RepID=UPI00214A7F8F|nr:TetR/AcrR family transcriptional regulator [Nocardioides carbamazepini]MCR1784006.1 TetR/AcrR family transcriptional regulator [Nocardioides carbamazepini]